MTSNKTEEEMEKIWRNKWQFVHTLPVKSQPPNKSFIEIASWVKLFNSVDMYIGKYISNL